MLLNGQPLPLLLVCLLCCCAFADKLEAPQFKRQSTSSSIIASINFSKFLECEAQGNPQPRYRWYKDGQPLTNDSTPNFHYRISHAQKDDAGIYHCVATNDVGSIFSDRFNFSVAYMDTFEDEDLKDETIAVESGQAAVLEMPPISSNPAPDVTWFGSGGGLPYDIKYAYLSNKLIILSASEQDELQYYRAKATNPQLGNEEFSHLFRLQVTGDSSAEIQPEIIVKPEDTTVVKGQEKAHLHCIANFRPLHELSTTWMKDDIPLESSGIKFSFLDQWNRTLVLSQANATYNGLYTCNVEVKTGGYAPIRAQAQVVVNEKPSFRSRWKREIVGEHGSTMELPCDAVGQPSPTLEWFRNTEKIEPYSEKRFEVTDDGDLIIRKLSVKDSGMFQCLAKNEAGEKSSYTWLKVKVLAPYIDLAPSNVTSLDGRDVTLNCRVSTSLRPNVTWLHESTPIDTSNSRRFHLKESGDLYVSDVRVSDAGKYTCICQNEAGSVNRSAWLSVLVTTRITRPPKDQWVLLGHTAELTCQVDHDPSMDFGIIWLHNDQVINTAANPRWRLHDDGTLEIIAVRASDVGNYTCSVTSTGGNETRSARVVVIELPFAPIKVEAKRVTEISPRTINVSWVPGFDGNSAIQAYSIQKREVPQVGPIPDFTLNWNTELSNISARNRWHIFDNLKASASYQFRVSARNSVGEGPHSEPSNVVMLPQEPPSGPPLNFLGSARSSSEIITQWQLPVEEHRNGHILGYVLRYKLHGYNETPWLTQNITNEAQRNYLITDLITWKDYIVQIAAYNVKGVGMFSNELKIKTKEGTPEAPPTEIRVKPLNSTSVEVSWKPPNPQKINGINQGYKIQTWWQGGFGEQNEFKSLKVAPNLFNPTAEQSAVVTGLKKFTRYNFTVLCYTNPGDGERSYPVSTRTEEDVPGKVENLQFLNISDRALTVRWQAPRETNGILTLYQVKYAVKGKPDTLQTFNLTTDQLELKIEQLQALTHYSFEVIAWTSKGPSEPSQATIQSGIKPVLPDPPTKLALSNIDAFSAVVQFTPGFNGNASISKWIVQAQTARNTTWHTIAQIYDPDAKKVTVENLTPFMEYKLRLIAENVVGLSVPSEPTKEFQTIQAPPSHPPRNVTVRAMSATELRVRWIPLQQVEWYGNPRGYRIIYTERRTNESKEICIYDHTANSQVLQNVEEFSVYEIVMYALNDVGSSQASPRAVERTRESVPSSGPINVEVNATSSTTVVVKWGEVPIQHQNGQIEGYKVYYKANNKSPIRHKAIHSNATFTTVLTELQKYVQYQVQVLAYTRLGDGALSFPPVRVQTFEDVPGPPSNVSFPDVSSTTARIIWESPEDPNGEILGYKVMFSLNGTLSHQQVQEFSTVTRTFQAENLLAERYYLFTIAAQSRLGWGKTAHVLVLTTNTREKPQPPSVPSISKFQIQSRQITFTWTPGQDGFAPLRFYKVQKSENYGPFQEIDERVDPSLNSYTAKSLKPFTFYQFRIQATNDVGKSDWSGESDQVRTLQAAPSQGISGLKVVPISTSSIQVHWMPIEALYWSGDEQTGGYRVQYQPSDYTSTLPDVGKLEIKGIDAAQTTLYNLTENRNYEVTVVPFNSEGDGPQSLPVTIYVGEAIPTGGPQEVVAEAVSSTEVQVRWKAPQASLQNGELLGYKIFYLVTDTPQDLEKKQEEEIEVVPASYNSHSLVFLDKYTEYRIQVLAFNPAGDGPRSSAIQVRTKEDLPGPPENLLFSEITFTNLIVSWDPPKMRNGQIVGYVVSYKTAGQNDLFSKQVRQKVNDTNLLVKPLEENVTYTFTVQAETIDLGLPISGNVTTGPQEGSPMPPTDLIISKTVSSIEFQWVNGATGKDSIRGYYIESKVTSGDGQWQPVAKTTSGFLTEYSLSYQNLQPSTSYIFRVITYNRFGISLPASSLDIFLTPSKLYMEYAYLQQQPFFRQTWFMVILAASSVVIVITVVAVLCVKSKSYQYKHDAQEALDASTTMDMDDRQDSDLELYRPQQSNGVGTLGRRGTLGRKNGHHPQLPPVYGKSPPRPSPASVAYHSDEESLKGYDENPDDSSVTEKPSEMSSTDSQQSESENESVVSDQHSFVNHYANVNDSLRQSWKRQKPVRNYSSYTDSEPEGSAVVSLNGGQIIMNNMARSRAPLPGFSSFV